MPELAAAHLPFSLMHYFGVIKPSRCDAVILGELRTDNDNEADAAIVASLLHLQDIVSPVHREVPLHVIGSIRNARTLEASACPRPHAPPSLPTACCCTPHPARLAHLPAVVVSQCPN